MKTIFYRLLLLTSRLLGPWFFIVIAKGIATGYFFTNSKRRKNSCYFYQVLFPGKSRLFYLYCTWKQFTNFTYVYLDRFTQRHVEQPLLQIEGRENLVAGYENGKGGILLMSHMGNWEVAAHFLTKILPNIKLLLYMGVRNKEEIEKIQKRSIQHDGVQVVGVDQDGGSPFDIVHGLHLLQQQGGFVSMAGDVVWRDDQRTVSGTLLGHCVSLPEAPFILSLVTGAPLIVFFAFRARNGQYRFSAFPPLQIIAKNREQRAIAIKKAAQAYLDHLETAIKRHPFEWFHFDTFIQPPSQNSPV